MVTFIMTISSHGPAPSSFSKQENYKALLGDLQPLGHHLPSGFTHMVHVYDLLCKVACCGSERVYCCLIIYIWFTNVRAMSHI